jgi:hypothetical protein
MERSILFTTKFKAGLGYEIQRNVARYSETELTEVFTAEQVTDLKAGKAITFRSYVEAVDLVAFYDAHK